VPARVGEIACRDCCSMRAHALPSGWVRVRDIALLLPLTAKEEKRGKARHRAKPKNGQILREGRKVRKAQQRGGQSAA